MLHRLRRHLRVLASIVLVAVSSLGAWSTAVHGLDCHDVEDGPSVVAHDASAHAFRGAALPAGERELHCVLCHWTRAFGPCVQAMAGVSSTVSRPLALPSDGASVAGLTVSSQPPLRAPPLRSASGSPA